MISYTMFGCEDEKKKGDRRNPHFHCYFTKAILYYIHKETSAWQRDRERGEGKKRLKEGWDHVRGKGGWNEQAEEERQEDSETYVFGSNFSSHSI